MKEAAAPGALAAGGAGAGRDLLRLLCQRVVGWQEEQGGCKGVAGALGVGQAAPLLILQLLC